MAIGIMAPGLGSSPSKKNVIVLSVKPLFTSYFDISWTLADS